MKIEATDLMIGDWVLYDGKPYRIVEIGGMLCLDTGDGDYIFVNFGEVKPIPLTPEILEDNGWVKGDGYYCYRLCDAERLEYWLDDWRLERIWAGKGDKYLVTFRAFVSCVHTLQHALKLCGIDKEIVL